MIKKNIEVIKVEIAKLELKKDDILIVRIKNYQLSSVELEEMSKKFKIIIPNNEILILEGDISLEKIIPR